MNGLAPNQYLLPRMCHCSLHRPLILIDSVSAWPSPGPASLISSQAGNKFRIKASCVPLTPRLKSNNEEKNEVSHCLQKHKGLRNRKRQIKGTSDPEMIRKIWYESLQWPAQLRSVARDWLHQGTQWRRTAVLLAGSTRYVLIHGESSVEACSQHPASVWCQCGLCVLMPTEQVPSSTLAPSAV